MTRHARTLAGLLALTLLVPLVAQAETLDGPKSPPVLILLGDPDPLATPGQPYSNTLQVTVMEAGVLGPFSFEDNGWTTISLEQPPGGTLPGGTEFELHFDVMPVDTSMPLRVSTTYNDRGVDWTYDLSLQGWERMNTARGIMSSGPAGESEGPVGSIDEPDEVEGSGPRRTIITYGRLVYWRDTSTSDDTPIKVGAYGVTVRVWDDDLVGRDPMGETITDADGNYSVVTEWTASEDPDIYVEFKAENAHMKIKPGPVATRVYQWETQVKHNLGGSNCDFHTGWPEDEDDWPALHIMTNLRRARNWMWDRGVAPSEDVVVYYPEGDWASYLNGHIKIAAVKAWEENTHIHEYGHHWMQDFGLDVSPPDYCNGNCDPDPPRDCTHCEWCEENPQDAWDEGVPNWFADVITRTFATDYGLAALWPDPNLQPVKCSPGAGEHDDPVKTEGFVHMFLWDIMDDVEDYTPGYMPQYFDRINRPDIDENDILAVLVADRPHTVLDFIEDFHASGCGGAPEASLWETAAHCGYYPLDSAPPSLVAGIFSSSHEIMVESPDRTIDFEWGNPGDDFSGIHGYAIGMYGAANVDPGYNVDLEHTGSAVFYTSDVLAPGQHYISVRARDQAGNWSSGFTYEGPYSIRDSLPADITYGRDLGAGVDGPLVLRDDATAAQGVVQWSATLPGDSENVYWNLITMNQGDEPVLDAFWNRLCIDGDPTSPAQNVRIASLAGGEYRNSLNQGPMTVPGGRHVVSALFDNREQISESNEWNNSTATQRSFLPSTIDDGETWTRPAPPPNRGGYSHYDAIPFPWIDNKDGVRFETGPGYDAVAIWAADNEDDYDCSLHRPTTSTTNGFRSADADTGHSTRAAGKIDVVLTNAHQTLPYDTWDVGIINANDDSSDYACTHVSSSPIFVGGTYSISMSADERLKLRGFELSSSELGWKEITLDSDPADGQIHLAWYAPVFEHGALTDHSRHDATGSAGRARVEFRVNTEGHSLVAIWRDPEDDPEGRLDAITFDLTVQTARPDLVWLEEPHFWYSCIVPRPDTDGTHFEVYNASYLQGDEASTYLNINLQNEGKTEAVGVECEVQVDGAPLTLVSMGDCPPDTNVTVNQTVPMMIPSGRHCLSVDADPSDVLDEHGEGNNRFAEQYVWDPVALPPGGLVERTMPSGPVGGWEAVSTLRGPLRFNCEGVELPDLGSVWYGAAILPESGTDVDVRLHEVVSGTKVGFGDPIAFSGWGAGESDFVVVNTAITTPRPFHVGLVGIEGSGNYLIDAAPSSFLASDPVGSYGPYSLDADELLDLHEVVLPAGDLQVVLSDDGNGDLGFSIHRGDLPFASKSQPLDDGISLMAPAGTPEVVAATIPSAGDYCVAVWRRAGPLARSAVAYTLDFEWIAGAPSDGPTLPARTSLVALTPSPFSERLHVALALAREEVVTVEVFNVRGQRIRTLVDRRLPGGHHTLVWHGDDAAGQPVSSGVYLVQMRAESGAGRSKAILLR